MKRDFEAIVLGLGGLGASAVYWLSRRLGGEVLGLEQFDLGHARGGSQDHSRIIRLSYHTPAYVRLAAEAYRAWAAVEQEAGEELVRRTGGLDLAPPAGAYPLEDYLESLTACDVSFDVLDAHEVMRRWPPFRLGEEIRGLFQPDGGLVKAARANAAHLRLTREHGAVLREGTAFGSLRPLAGEIEVVAGGVAYRCHRLVLTCGAWTNRALAGFGLELPLRVTQEQVTYFRTPHLEAFAPERFPIWIWLDEPCFYGFPASSAAS